MYQVLEYLLGYNVDRYVQDLMRYQELPWKGRGLKFWKSEHGLRCPQCKREVAAKVWHSEIRQRSAARATRSVWFDSQECKIGWDADRSVV